MSRRHRGDDVEREELKVLKEQEQILKEQEETERSIKRDLDKVVGFLEPHLRVIKIAFTKGTTMAEGPVVLSSGQSTIASIDYFDQTGNPMPAGFVPPNVTYSIDNSALASSAPVGDNQTDLVTYVSAGVANLTGAVISAEGLALSDTETVTCSPVVLPPPVLASVKINFSAPTGGTVTPAVKK